MLELLREIENDGHYLELGFASLFEFATKNLNYSSGATYRRIQSMRLLKSVPDLQAKIEDGSLSLCVTAQTQGFFRAENQKRKDEGEAKLTQQLADIALKKIEPKKSPVAVPNKEPHAQPAGIRPLATSKSATQPTYKPEPTGNNAHPGPISALAQRSRYLPASIKRAVFARDQGQCRPHNLHTAEKLGLIRPEARSRVHPGSSSA